MQRDLENVAGKKRPALARSVMIYLPRGHKISESQSDSRDNIIDSAAGEVVKQNAAVIAFANRQTWGAILVSRAARNPPSRPGALNLVEPR